MPRLGTLNFGPPPGPVGTLSPPPGAAPISPANGVLYYANNLTFLQTVSGLVIRLFLNLDGFVLDWPK